MLRAVSLPPPAAADAIRAAWDRAQPVAPVDSAAPAEHGAAFRAGEPVDPSVAAVVATSGTTGEPRAVELTWRGLQAMASAVDSRPDDHWLACLPFHHVAGLAVLARTWATGAALTVLPRFDVAEVAAVTAATHVSLVPTQLRRLLAAGVDLSRFRRILVGGGPVPDDLRALPGVVVTYGLTETWGGVVHDGIPLRDVEVVLAPDGEILVRSPTVMRGYRADPAATAAAFTPDGLLRTGDLGAWTPDGRLQVVDRKRDLVITGGVNVSPAAVERALAGHPAVADVCVAGAPDEEWGERVVAYVVPADPARPPGLGELREHARPRLDPAALPKEVVIVDTIPRTPSGKPLRGRLRRGDHDPC